MNTKKIIVAAIAGFVVYFLLGWLFYGVLFTDLYPKPENEAEHLQFVALGCLFFSLLISYVWVKWAGFTNWISGLKAGAIFGLLYGTSMNMFMASGMQFVMENFIKDMIATVVSVAILGAVIAFVNDKMK